MKEKINAKLFLFIGSSSRVVALVCSLPPSCECVRRYVVVTVKPVVCVLLLFFFA